MHEMVISQVLDATRKSFLITVKNLLEKKKLVSGSYATLYDLLSEYPFRTGKSLRPALCISTARAVGGLAQMALTSSTAIELFHNAALLHDDLEDESLIRRGAVAMNKKIGIGRTVNLGDATQVLSLSLLLENLKCIGVAKSMYVMHEIEHMARQSVEGQAIELDWIANLNFDLSDEDYFRMCTKKTCWYTFISPCRIGYIIGLSNFNEVDTELHLSQLTSFGMALGIAFQIQDDLLNLIGDRKKYGKEICGDIFEGKRTIMLNHVMTNATDHQVKLKEIMCKPRSEKSSSEVKFVLKQMVQTGSIDYGKALAADYANKAHQLLNEMNFLKIIDKIKPEEIWQSKLTDRRFIESLVTFVVTRDV